MDNHPASIALRRNNLAARGFADCVQARVDGMAHVIDEFELEGEKESPTID